MHLLKFIIIVIVTISISEFRQSARILFALASVALLAVPMLIDREKAKWLIH